MYNSRRHDIDWLCDLSALLLVPFHAPAQQYLPERITASGTAGCAFIPGTLLELSFTTPGDPTGVDRKFSYLLIIATTTFVNIGLCEVIKRIHRRPPAGHEMN